MTAYTSSQAGNWNSAATWGAAGVPGNGDTATVAHAVAVTVNAIVGTSGVAGTAAVAINSGGTVTVNNGITFTTRGDINCNAGNLVLNAGGALVFDSSLAAAPSTTSYLLNLGTSHNTAQRLTANGTVGVRCSISSVAGSAFGRITSGAGPYLQGGLVTLSYTDITRIGDATHDAISTYPSTSGNSSTLQNCIFDTCGRFTTAGNIADGTTFSIKNCTWKNSAHATDSFSIGSPSAITSGTREVKNCVFDKQVHYYAGKGLTLSGNVYAAAMDTTAGLAAGFTNELFLHSTNTPYGNLTDCYSAPQDLTDNPHHISYSSGNADGFTVQGCIFEATPALNTTDAGDCVIVPNPSGSATFTIKNCLVLPAANGVTSGVLVSALGGANTLINCDHNTWVATASDPTSNKPALMSVGETYNMTSGQVTSFRSNLVWAPSAINAYLMRNINGAPVTDTVSAANADYNCELNMLAGSAGKGYNAPFSGTPGAHDLNASPVFVDPTRNLSRWDASLGGPGTAANAIAQLKKQNDVTGYNPAYTIQGLIGYVRAGFAPTNVSLRGAGHDGADIGAIAYITTGSSSGTTPASGTAYAVPNKAQWLANLIEWAGYEYNLWILNNGWSVNYTGNSGNGDPIGNVQMDAAYYDGQHTMWVAYSQTGSASTWNPAIQLGRRPYRDYYVEALSPPGGVIANWNFTEGLRKDWEINGDATSKQAIYDLSRNGSFCPDTTPLSWSADPNGVGNPGQGDSRVNAYRIVAELNARAVGFTPRAILDAWIDQSYSHLDIWTNSQTSNYVRPFMVALTAFALIKAYTEYKADARLIPALSIAANYCWNHCWVDTNAPSVYNNAFTYTDRITPQNDPAGNLDLQPAPDLNLLIAPMYAWLWSVTGVQSWRDKWDKIFAGGVSVYNGALYVSGAYLGGRSQTLVKGKSVNQCYFWSDKGVAWAETAVTTGTIVPPAGSGGTTSTPPPATTGSGTSTSSSGAPSTTTNPQAQPQPTTGVLIPSPTNNAIGVIIQAAATELNLGTFKTVVGNTDGTAKQLLQFANSGLEDLRNAFEWPQLRKEYVFTLVNGVTNYPLPYDFDRFVYDTDWDRTNHWPLIGPISESEWAYYKSGIISSYPRNRFKVSGCSNNQINIYPAPGAGDDGRILVFSYQSLNHILPVMWAIGAQFSAGTYCSYDGNIYYTVAGGTTGINPPTHTVGSKQDAASGGVNWQYWNAPYEYFLADTDTPLYERRLVSLSIQIAFLISKGLDSTLLQERFNTALRKSFAKLSGAKTLNLAGETMRVFVGPWNLPDGNWPH